MPDAFDKLPGRDSAKGDALDKFAPQEESGIKSFFRTAYQPVSGLLQASTYPLDIMHMLALGEALDPEEIDRIRAISEREGIPFDEEKYMEDLQRLAESFPTQGNIEHGIEERTGAPLEAQTRLQKALKFGTTVAKTIPKPKPGGPVGYGIRGTQTALPRPVLGGAVAGAREGLVAAGVPELAADVGSIALIKGMPGGSSSIGIGKEKKPSGMTTRRYESFTEPKKISKGAVEKINEKVESEFRDISDDILAKSPIGETHTGLKNDVTFKQAAREGFERVEALAEQIPTKIPTKDVKKAIIDRMAKNKGTGFTPSEYEKSHKRFIEEFIKDTPDVEILPQDLVRQFRKNNKGFGEINEPGQSYAHNQAKRDALRDYNLAIEDVISEKFPDSEFPKIFKDVNENWSKIMDAETIDKFTNDLFDGKIQFKKGRDFFDKNGVKKPFQRALGEEGFKNFQTLMEDLMSTEKANSMLKVAKSKGFGELAEVGLGYLIHPTLGKAKIGYGIAKGVFKKGVEMLLDKPNLAVTWDRGVKAFKKGDFKMAQKEFQVLEKEKERLEALGKFNEKIKAPESEISSP